MVTIIKKVKKLIANFHYISDSLKDKSHAELSELACKSGVKWVQLRVKDQSSLEWKKTAIEVQKICKNYEATFIINDNVMLTKTLNADGVHLGKEDLSVFEARSILGPNKIIGGSANTSEDILNLVKQQVDYIGLGPFKFTNTKKNLNPILGQKKFEEIVKEAKQNMDFSIPIIAIGGIKLEDVNPIMATSINGIAVSSAVNYAPSPELASKSFIKKLRLTNKNQIHENQPQYS